MALPNWAIARLVSFHALSGLPEYNVNRNGEWTLTHPVFQVVCRQPLTAEVWVRSRAGPCRICGGRSGTGTSFSPSISVLPCQYHSTNAPYSFIHLPPTLYNVFLPVLQFSPVSIIPPMLHTHSFIYHRRCIMYFSQYFSFPLSVSFHQCSIHIHPTTAVAGKCLSPSS
jgi:hypothetical protein